MVGRRGEQQLLKQNVSPALISASLQLLSHHHTIVSHHHTTPFDPFIAASSNKLSPRLSLNGRSPEMAALSEPSMSTESTLEPSYSSSANKEMNSADSSNANAMSIDQGHQLTQNVDQSHLITIAPASTQPLMSEHTHDALDALASLASGRAMVSEDSAQITPHQTSSDDDDSESMPPPPPREPLANSPAAFYTRPDESTLLRELPLIPARLGRLRSASNPEGMEKWDSYSRRNDRQHFVLPSSILEEELASTRRVLGEVDGNGEDGVLSSTVGHEFQFTNYSYYDQSNVQEFTMLTPGESLPVSYSTSMLGRKKRQIKPTMKALGTSSDSVTDAADATKAVKKSPKRKPKSPEIANKNSEEEDEEEDESLLEPEELLRRARSRLLEDLSEGAGEKGVLTLPHSLGKYKEVSVWLSYVANVVYFCPS